MKLITVIATLFITATAAKCPSGGKGVSLNQANNIFYKNLINTLFLAMYG